jgi:antitoxin (DNA-binding transcriptional repressor) of toxin-antitoxin stability system
MKDVLRAIDRGETVTVLYRGTEKAQLVPIKTNSSEPKPSEHPACGMWAEREDLADPVKYVRTLRKSRITGLSKRS